jgi:hypothetical protein
MLGNSKRSISRKLSSARPRAIPRHSSYINPSHSRNFKFKSATWKKSNVPIKCNIFLVKRKTGVEQYDYSLYSEKTSNIFNRTILTEAKIKEFERIFNEDASKICIGVGGEFIDEVKNNDIVILQFSESRISTRKPSHRTSLKINKRKYSLCGLICLNMLMDNAMYLSLICARKSLGTKLLQLAEDVSRDLGKTRLFLKSIDTPMAFYLYKEYKFLPGQNNVDLSKIHTIKFGKDPCNQLLKHGRIKRNNGILTKSLNCKKSNFLVGVKGDSEDGIAMFKQLVI